MDKPLSANFKPLTAQVAFRLDDILYKHGFGRLSELSEESLQGALDDLVDKFCSLIIHLDKTVDDLQYKLAAARQKK